MIRGDSASVECRGCLVYYGNRFRWNIGAKLTSEIETEEETVFPPINIGYAALSPYCDISSASMKVSLERSSFNEELELESDPEGMEDELFHNLTLSHISMPSVIFISF